MGEVMEVEEMGQPVQVRARQNLHLQMWRNTIAWDMSNTGRGVIIVWQEEVSDNSTERGMKKPERGTESQQYSVTIVS